MKTPIFFISLCISVITSNSLAQQAEKLAGPNNNGFSQRHVVPISQSAYENFQACLEKQFDPERQMADKNSKGNDQSFFRSEAYLDIIILNDDGRTYNNPGDYDIHRVEPDLNQLFQEKFQEKMRGFVDLLTEKAQSSPPTQSPSQTKAPPEQEKPESQEKSKKPITENDLKKIKKALCVCEKDNLTHQQLDQIVRSFLDKNAIEYKAFNSAARTLTEDDLSCLNYSGS